MRTSLLKYSLLAFAFAMVTTISANAMAFGTPVPEIDPSVAVCAFTLLAGSVLVLRARRRK